MKLKINNFRSFIDQEFVFSKYNIFIGPNNAGKSSIIKFLLILRQSLETANENLNISGPYLDLGNYSDIIRNYNDELNLSFSFELDNKYIDYFFEIVFPNDEQQNTENLHDIKNKLLEIKTNNIIYFEINKNLRNHESSKITIENKNIGKIIIESYEPKKKKFESETYCKIIFNPIDKEEIVLENLLYNQTAFFRMAIANDLFNNCRAYEDIYPNLFYNIAYLLVSQNYIEDFLLSIKYINPVKSKPERFYYKRDVKNDPTANTLEDFLMLIQGPTINDEEKKILFEILNKISSELGIAEKVNIINYERPPVLEVRAKIAELDSNIEEVGYGVALQIPIILSLILYNNKTIFLEQPEVHLFPQLEAKLVEILIKYGRENIFFIETQSEHIIRKLQVLIKNNMYNLRSEDVTINYFNREKNQTVVTNYSIEQDGLLNPMFPSGFFDNSYKLALELLK